MSLPIRTAVISFVSFLCLSLSNGVSAQSSHFNYSYLTRTESGITLHLLDPYALKQTPLIINLSIPGGYSFDDLAFTQASPDGRWIVLMFRNPITGTIIQIINPATRQSHDVIRAAYLNDIPLTSIAPMWSPDSRYIVFNALADPNFPTGPLGSRWSDREKLVSWPPQGNVFLQPTYLSTYLYTVTTGSTKLLRAGSEENSAYRLVWSNDSKYLALASRSCRNGVCRGLVEILDIAGRLSNSLKIEFDNTLCSLLWSPDGRKISFVSSCATYPLSAYLREIFVWNIHETTASALTANTNPIPLSSVQHPKEFRASYDHIWLDTTTIIAGSAVVEFQSGTGLLPNTLGVKTIALQDGKTSLLSTEMSSEWAVNPVSKQIAFRSDSLQVLNGDNMWRVNRSEVKLATFNAAGLSVSLTVPAGKNLAWSQDGKTLAYFKDIHQTLSIVFINESRQPYEYSIIGTSKLFLVGWLNVPANTPTGTPSSGS